VRRETTRTASDRAHTPRPCSASAQYQSASRGTHRRARRAGRRGQPASTTRSRAQASTDAAPRTRARETHGRRGQPPRRERTPAAGRTPRPQNQPTPAPTGARAAGRSASPTARLRGPPPESPTPPTPVAVKDALDISRPPHPPRGAPLTSLTPYETRDITREGDSEGFRVPFCRDLTSAEVVPMQRGHSGEPRGASAGRPTRASAARGRKRSQPRASIGCLRARPAGS
jgi:hypothetical protein